MRRLSEIQGEEAIDVMAALMSPASIILSDESVKERMQRKNSTMAEVAAYIAKNHKDSVIDMLTILSGKTRNEYVENMSVLSLVQDVIYMFNEPELQELFTGQAQSEGGGHSGPATATTKGATKKASAATRQRG